MTVNLIRLARAAVPAILVAACVCQVVLAQETGAVPVAASVNGKPITMADYCRRLQLYPSESGVVFPPNLPQQAGFAVLNKMISEQVFLEFARQEEVTPTQEQIDARKKQLDLSLQERGTSLAALLAQCSISEQEFDDTLRPEIAQTNVIAKYVQISDDELQVSYEQATIGLPEDQRYRSAFYLPESVFLLTIITATKESADEALKFLNQGMPFEEVAKQYSQDTVSKGKGGEVGWLTRPDEIRKATPGIPPEIYEKALSLKTGETTEPFQVGGQWVILRAREHTDARMQPFERVKGIIRDRLLQQRAQDNKTLQDKLQEVRKTTRVEVLVPAYVGRIVESEGVGNTPALPAPVPAAEKVP